MKNGIEAQYYYELLEWKDSVTLALSAFMAFCEFIYYRNGCKGSKKRSMHELTEKELKELYFLIFGKQI